MNEKNNSYKQMVLDTANKSGFNLEFRTRKLLEELNYTCKQNTILNHGNHKVEIDVVGNKKSSEQSNGNIRPIHLLIECKGSSKEGCLILIKSSEDKRNEYNNILPNKGREICFNNSNFYFPTFELNSTESCYAITGDFFNRSTKNELKKCSIQDDSNNFYKARKQLLDSIEAYAIEDNRIKHDIEEYGNAENDDEFKKNILCPLIVTNCPIWVIDYNGEQETATQYKGALQYVTESPYALPVINIEYLKEIIEKIELQCGRNKIQLSLSLDEK